MESIITIATVLTMYFNAANDVNSQYLYNSDLTTLTLSICITQTWRTV